MFKNSLAPGRSDQHASHLPGRQVPAAGRSRNHVPSRQGLPVSESSAIQTAAESGLETRSRDPLQDVPLFATEGKASSSGVRRVQQKHRQRGEVLRLTNDMIRGVQALYRGSVQPTTDFGARVRPNSAAVPSPEIEGLRRELLDVAEDHHRRIDGNLCARAALQQLTKEGLAYNHVSRGDVVRAKVENIDLPATDSKVEISAVGGVAGDLIREWPKILRDPPPSPAEVAQTGSYGDPALRGKARIRLAVRMWIAGMLRGCRKTCPVGVDVFTVHKKTKDGVDLQRLIFDLRRVNLFFEKPWPCAMGSLSAMSGLDLSDRNLGRSAEQSSRPDGDAEWELVGLVGDVPDFFYRVLIPEEMTGWFWLQDVDPVELYEALLLEGIKAEELLGAEAVGVSVLCMGWSWAPWFAQELLQEVLMKGVPEFEPDGAMRHKHPPPDISPEHPVAHLEYIDDFGAVVMQPRESSMAASVQCRARDALRACGLDVHKEALGAVFELLGAESDLNRRLVLPKSEKFGVVICATRGVVMSGFASPHEVDVLLGHWTHYALLQRTLYSIMDEVYEFVRRPPSGPVAIPQGVRRELAMLVALAPLVRADLSLDWCPVVSMVDAGPQLGAVVYSEFKRADVAKEGRLGLVTGWEYGMPPSPVPEAWSNRGWRLGAQQQWRNQEHNNITEGRCVVMAVQRLSRCRKGRQCRMLVVTDSLVVLGSFRKGRSSNQGLLYLSRRLAGLTMGYNIRVALRYVPSERNMADGPSRGAHYACVAKETLHKAARKSTTTP